MIKINKKFKKILAVLMLILMLCNSIPISIFAAYITDVNSNAEFGVVSGSLSTYKHELHYANYDGKTYMLFCCQRGITSPNGKIYEYGSEFISQLNADRPAYKKIAEMVYFGYTMPYGYGLPTSTEAKKAACATQQYVWEYIHNNIDSSFGVPTRDSWNSNYMSSSIYSSWLNNTENLYNSYHNTNVSFNKATYKVNVGESATYTDTNGVLASYPSFEHIINGVTFRHSQGSNDININVSKTSGSTTASFSSNKYKVYRLMPNGDSYDEGKMASYIYFDFKSGSIQDLMFSSYVDPNFFGLNIEVQSGNVELTKTDSTGTSISGCKFGLHKDSGCTQEVSTATSNSYGKILFENLIPGTYYVKELSVPNGYLIDTTVKSVNVENGRTGTVYFTNNEPLGEIRIYKVSENGDKVKNATFKITAAEKITNVSKSKTFYNQGDIVATITSNSDGIASKTELPMGKYLVQETNAPEGYLLNETVYPANLEYKNSTTPIIEIRIEGIVNHEPTGTISLVKRDAETGSVAQGDGSLENAVYKLYANEDIYNVAKTKKFYSKGDLVATRTTDMNGNTENITGLPLGSYILKEDTASKGYLVDQKEYEINLVYKDQHTKIITNAILSNEQVKKQQIHIYKSGIKVQSGKVDGLEGAEFIIKLFADVEKALKKGYSYEEIWNGIDEYGNNVNVDSKRVSEAQVIAPSYQTVVTDENGNAYTKELPFGKYLVKETKTPKDYYSSEDFTFTISQDESEIKDIAQKVKDIFVNDEQMETYIKLVKKDSDSGKVVSLSSATFQIKATKDIYDRGNGKIIYKKGEIITQKIGSTVYNSFTTNSKNIVVPNGSYTNNKEDNGTVITPLMLPVGSYEITEIQIPTGFLQLDKPVTFNVEGIRDYDKDNEGDYIKEVIVKNVQPKGTLIINKSVALRENVDTSLVDISDLSGIQFKLVAKEDIIDYSDGSIVYKKGQEIKIYNLDKNGDLKVENLWMGSYELQEVKTIDGLVLNDKKYDVTFEQKDVTTKVYNETREVVNDTTLIEVSKQDITGEKELEGAKLSVIDSNGKVADSWTSTNKPHSIEGLIVDKEYTLREEIAPNGFVKATDIKFTIKNTNEIQKVIMIDKVAEMTKANIGGEELEGAKIQVLDKNGKIVDEWISENTPHRIKGLEENSSYILHEEVAIEGYVKATDIHFTVTDDKETQQITMIDKIVEMTKTDIGGEELEGATIQVLDKNGKIVDEWVSSKEPHRISGLEENQTYTLHEEVAIEGYVKATDVEFTVTEDKETQKLTLIDKIVSVTKTDLTTGDEIEGAELVVTDEDGNTIDEWTSTKEEHHISGLEEGKTYTLTEKTAPYGYEIAESITFTVSYDKVNETIEMKDMPILKTIKVIKADSSSKNIIKDNFKFAIFEDAECTKLIKEVKSSVDEGFAEFENLRYGTYYIKETKAPHGYQLSDKIVEIEINDKGVFADEIILEEKDGTYSFIFYDDLIPVVQTGNEINYILVASLMGLSLIGVSTGVIILKRKNRKEN